MKTWFYRIVPASASVLGVTFLWIARNTLVEWRELMLAGDTSVADHCKTMFWYQLSIAVLLLMLSAFVAGRWVFQINLRTKSCENSVR